MMIGRRSFMAGGGAALAWPLKLTAQQYCDAGGMGSSIPESPDTRWRIAYADFARA